MKFSDLFALSAKQHRWISRIKGNLNKQIVIQADEARAILRKTGIERVMVRADQEYICPDNGKVSEKMMRVNFCNPFYGRGTNFEPPGNCVYYSRFTAEKFQGYAFGVMTVRLTDGDFHRLNIFINRKKEVWAWDPQTCNYPGGNSGIQERLIVHMGTGLENVGNHPERYDDEFKKIYEGYDKIF